MTRSAFAPWQVRAIVRIAHQMNVASQDNGESACVVLFKRYTDGRITLQVLDSDREETLRDSSHDRTRRTGAE